MSSQHGAGVRLSSGGPDSIYLYDSYSSNADEERALMPTPAAPPPPLDWNAHKEAIRQRFESKRMSEEQVAHMPSRVRSFYRKQNLYLDTLQELYATKDAETEAAQQQKEEGLTKWTVYLSFGMNVLLLIIKLYAAVSSRSLSVIASAVDSVLDLVSGGILFVTARAIRNRDPMVYPVGRRRLEPLGIIVFAAVMGTAALQLITTSIEALAKRSTSLNVQVSTIVILLVTITVKLLLYVWCRCVGRKSAIVNALATDHITDVMVNGVGTACAVIAKYYLWWTDALGAILLALWIIRTWFSTGYEQLLMLAGHTAPNEFLNKISFLAHLHHEQAEVDTVRAYYFGLYFMVEVDIKLPEDMPLRTAHDIGEALAIRIEEFDEVERAFVHIDFETTHKPEHKVL